MVDTTNLKSYADYKQKIQENLDKLYQLTDGDPASDMFHENVTDENILKQIQQLEFDNAFLIARVLTEKFKTQYIKLDESKEGNKDNLFPIGYAERIFALPMFRAINDTPPSIEITALFFGTLDVIEDVETNSILANNDFYDAHFIYYVDAAYYMYKHSIDDFFKKIEESVITRQEFIEKFTYYSEISLRYLETNLNLIDKINMPHFSEE